MRAGRLDTIFDIEKPIKTQTASGAVLITWETFATGIWGYFFAVDAVEKYNPETGFLKESQYMLEIRPLDGLTVDMRLVIRPGRYIYILAINDLGFRDRIVMKIREGLND